MNASTLMRKAILATAGHAEVERLVRANRLVRTLAPRFVAGETIDDAIAAALRLRAARLAVTLDHLGENVATREAAQSAVSTYAATLRRMRAEGVPPNISVKLTMLGLDIADDLAFENMADLLGTAAEVDGFVRIDMEGSAYTERTIEIAVALHERFPRRVGAVIQAMLCRSPRDIERLIERQIRVRLVKGAYAEPPEIALQRPAEIDAAFTRLMERLLEDGPFPAIATHDPALIRATRDFARRMGIAPTTWEFQMLYGVRREAQRALAAEGYGMRVYVPFGADWYPYITRRIAERPANLFFVLRQLASR